MSKMNEAGISFNQYVTNLHTGETGQITIRAEDADQWSQRYQETMAILALRGFVPEVKRANQNTTHVATVTTKKVEVGNTFETQQLRVELYKGYMRFGILGPKSKFPVRVDAAILKTVGLKPEEFVPGTDYPMSGYVATFEANEKGYPKKVIGLKAV